MQTASVNPMTPLNDEKKGPVRQVNPTGSGLDTPYARTQTFKFCCFSLTFSHTYTHGLCMLPPPSDEVKNIHVCENIKVHVYTCGKKSIILVKYHSYANTNDMQTIAPAKQ